jgi:hypothetical protein
MFKSDAIVIIAIYIVIYAGIPALVMWIASRLIGPRTAMAIGFLAGAFVFYEIADMHRVCSAEPVIRPSRTPGGLGFADLECDSLVGATYHMFIWYAGPISVALLIAATFFQYREFRRKRSL